MSQQNLLFIYGTLQRGERANHYLQTAEYLGDATTVSPAKLVDCGGFPGLVDIEEIHVCGEVYAIPEELWPTLDDYEGVADGDYSRTRIDVRMEDGKPVDAWTYLWLRSHLELPYVGASWKTYRASLRGSQA